MIHQCHFFVTYYLECGNKHKNNPDKCFREFKCLFKCMEQVKKKYS